MQVNFNQPNFTGHFSKETLKRAEEFLSPQQMKKIKNFRAGGRYTKISIKSQRQEPVRLQNGSVVIPEETYVEFSNTRRKNGPKSRIKLADFELPLNMETFKKITNEMVAYGEKLMNMYK